MRKKPIYYSILWSALIISFIILIIVAPNLYKPDYILSDDFGHFWASGKLFIDGKNPYDLDLLFSTQAETGAVSSSSTSIGSQTLNPPWTLLLFVPFSLLDYSLARILWLLINITFLIMCIKIFWNFAGGEDKKLWLALLVSFCFTPTYSVLSKGQITPWIVLGITVFILYTEEKINIWWAGISLTIISTKPQLFYLLWPALGIWVISKRNWKLLLSGLGMGCFAILTTQLVNNQAFAQYIAAIQDYPYDQWATPTFGAYIRFFWLGVDKFWVQYLAACFGLGWLIFHYRKHREHWRWNDQIPVLAIISLLTSPYAWTYDAVIILPAILVATTRLIKQKTLISIGLWLIYLIINLSNLLIHTQLSDFWFIWLVPSYALWFYIISKYNQHRSMKIQESQ